MKRIPVTQASYKKINQPKSPKGVSNVPVTSGKVDKKKTRQASYLGMGGFGSTFGRPSMIGAASTFYNNSYMAGGHTGGLGDVPPFVAILNQQNGGILYYPATLRQKFQFYRFFYRFDPYVKAAVDLNTDLPMSRLQLRMPKMQDKKLSKRIEKFYQKMIQDLHLFDKLHSMLFQCNILGNCIVFIEYDEKQKKWDKLVILPPQEVNVANYPMSDIKRIQYRPQMLNSIISKYDIPLDSYEDYKQYVQSLPEQEQSVLQDVSYEFIKQLRQNNGTLMFDTDPYQGDGDDKIGSFAFHFTSKRHEYQDWGVSPLECVLIPLLQKTHYQYTQLSLAARNMTPRDLVVADGITPEALQELRDQVDQSMLSPDYKIVTNYQVQWETIGAQNRLIDLQRQYEVIQNQLFAGLGVTRQLLTGQGMYSGNKISIQILNTKYLLVRQVLQKFVQESLFKPIALQNGFYHDDEDGNREWYYPKLGFTRLTIRDNAEVFDSLFQLYQKGSLPIGMVLDIFNINADDVDEELKRDMFTPRDATYNEMLRQVYSALGDKLSESTDLAKQVAESITGPAGRKLKYVGQDADKDEMNDDFSTQGADFGGGNDNMDFNPEEINMPKQMQEQMNQEPSDEQNNQEETNQEQNIENEEESEDKVNEYINSIIKNKEVTNDDNVKDYIKDVTNNDSEDDNVNNYINNIVNEQKNVNQYINSFLGNDTQVKQSDDWSEQMQSAGLDDNEVEEVKSKSKNDVADFLTEN